MKKETQNFTYKGDKANNFFNEAKEYKEKEKNRKVHHYKVILVGDGGVGKTSIYEKFTTNSFSGNMSNTMKIESRVKSIEIDNENIVDMQVWDTCGQEKFKTVTRSYYRNNNGCIIVFDLTCKESFKNILEWHKDLKEYGLKEQIIVVVGNKKDLLSQRVVFLKEIDDFIIVNNLYYIEVSAKSGENLRYLFEYMALKFLARDEHLKKIPENSNYYTTSDIMRNSITLDRSMHSVQFNKRRENVIKKKQTCC